MVGPGRVVVGDPRMEDEVVVAARDAERVELDRPEPLEDRHDALRTGGQRPRGSEEVPADEEATCGRCRDLECRHPASDRRWARARQAAAAGTWGDGMTGG